MLDLSKFHKIKPPITVASLYLRVSENNIITFNSKLLEKINRKEVSIFYSDDCRQMIIDTENAGADLNVKANGDVRIADISGTMKKSKIKLPARYNVEWDNESKLWVCDYCGDYVFKNMAMPFKPRKIQPKVMRIYEVG